MKTTLRRWEEKSKFLQEENKNLTSKLQKLSKRSKKEKEELEEKLKKLAEQKNQLETELLSKNLTESLPNVFQNENDNSLNETLTANSDLKINQGKTDDLKIELFNKQKELANLPDDQSRQSLLDEIARLQKELEESNQKIKELQEKIKDFEQQVNIDCQKLQDQIKTKRLELEKIKEEAKEYSWKLKAKDLFGSYEEVLNELSEAQIEITRFNSNFAAKRKETILKDFDNEKLNDFCQKQAELTKLEMQLDYIQKNAMLIGFDRNWEKEEKNLKDIMIASSMPPQLSMSAIKKLRESSNCDEDEIIYSKTYPKNNFKEYIEKRSKSKSLSQDNLPTRLYNIKEDYLENFKEQKIEEAKYKEGDNRYLIKENLIPNQNVKSYALLSYVWGRKKNNDDLLSPLGKKSLAKARAACQFLEIDYLWIDQLCINQRDVKEKNYEVPQMQKYYSDSMVTLISIQTELDKRDFVDENRELSEVDLLLILEKIIKSKWFIRSWTFQEGFLSRQTIFMFDDYLIDGRYLAQVWALNQPSVHASYSSLGDLNSVKVATPIGWAYCEQGYKPEDRVTLRLDEALRTIKKRERGISIDGIYSVLSLLPYGNQVKPNYKEWGQPYTEKDLNKALLNIMKAAIANGYGEPLAWHGQGSEEKGFCWLPRVDNNGSTNVEGGIDIRINENISPEKVIKFDKKGWIEISAAKYDIHKVASSLSQIDKGNLIESGVYMRNIELKSDDDRVKSITLLGTKDTLGKLNSHRQLLIPNREQWVSSKPFALLVKRTGNNLYHRLGLVELLMNSNEVDILFKKENQMIEIGMIDQQENQYENQIQIPPKN